MLSVVPLLNGGEWSKTGAGGICPPARTTIRRSKGTCAGTRSVKFCALVASSSTMRGVQQRSKARLLADTLDQAIGEHLEHQRAPSRRVNELDTRGSHFYLALYWAQALAKQDQDPDLKARFADVARRMEENEEKIVQELVDAQGETVSIGGYYRPDSQMAAQAMRPSATLNAIIDAI